MPSGRRNISAIAVHSMQLPLSQLLLLSSCAHYRDCPGGLGMHAMQKLPVLQVNVVVMQPLAVSDPKWMSMGLGAVM